MEMYTNINKWAKFQFPISDEMKDGKNFDIKILVLGEKGVGKTSIIQKFTLNKFSLEIKTTSHSLCYTKELVLLDDKINLFIIDIDEHTLKHDRGLLYENTTAAIVVYDITKSKTFDNVDYWISDIRTHVKVKIPIFIFGNKSDLGFLRNVDIEEGVEKAEFLESEVLETSCLDDSVYNAFKILIVKLYFEMMDVGKKKSLKYLIENNLSK